MQSEPKSIKYLLRCNEYQEFVGWCNEDYEYVSEIIFYHTKTIMHLKSIETLYKRIERYCNTVKSIEICNAKILGTKIKVKLHLCYSNYKIK